MVQLANLDEMDKILDAKLKEGAVSNLSRSIMSNKMKAEQRASRRRMAKDQMDALLNSARFVRNWHQHSSK